MSTEPYHIECPSCKGSMPMVSNESVMFACIHCHTVFRQNREFVNMQADTDKLIFMKALELGDVYSHEETDFIITGKIVKCEHADPQAIWTEYILTHPEAENIYLSDYNGHWNLVIYQPEGYNGWSLGTASNTLVFLEDLYPFYHQYKVDILLAEGEFNFDFMEDQGNRAFEYINPPGLLIIEYNEPTDTRNFFSSTYLYRSELRRQLKRKVKLPKPIGIAGSQPFKYDIHVPHFHIGSLILIALMLAAQFAYKYAYPDLSLTKTVMSTTQDNSNAYNVTNMRVPYADAIMDMKIHCSSLYNDWAGLQFSLINDSTGEERYFDMETEYYSGYEGGESWSEGSQESTGSVTQLDKGKYRLEVKPMQEAGSPPKEFELEIGVYKASWSIFWILTGLLLLINIILHIMMGKFEADKWGEDYFETE